jgi:hypothetical protein
MRAGVDLLGSVLQYSQNRTYDSFILELRGKLQWHLWSDTTALAAAGAVVDLSRNGRVGGDRRGVMVSLRTETRIDEGRQLNLQLQHQMLDDSQVYNETLFGDLKRTPVSGFFSARFSQQLNLRGSGYIQLTRNWRDDLIPLFRMSSTLLSIGYQW